MRRTLRLESFGVSGVAPGELVVASMMGHPTRGPVCCPAAPVLAGSHHRPGLTVHRRSLPTTGAGGGTRADEGDLPALRSAAARFQHDVLVVVSTHRNRYDDWNPLAVTYLGILPVWFVPGDSLAVYASAEACALDVRSGLFLACAQGQGKAERALVTTIGREQRMRELSTAALGEAFEAIPETLRQGVRARLARRAS